MWINIPQEHHTVTVLKHMSSQIYYEQVFIFYVNTWNMNVCVLGFRHKSGLALAPFSLCINVSKKTSLIPFLNREFSNLTEYFPSLNLNSYVWIFWPSLLVIWSGIWCLVDLEINFWLTVTTHPDAVVICPTTHKKEMMTGKILDQRVVFTEVWWRAFKLIVYKLRVHLTSVRMDII
jgi:hypothetical protein